MILKHLEYLNKYIYHTLLVKNLLDINNKNFEIWCLSSFFNIFHFFKEFVPYDHINAKCEIKSNTKMQNYVD